MSDLIKQIRTDLVAAMKSKDAVRQRTLRSAIAAVQEAEVAGKEAAVLDDAGVQQVIKAQIKRRNDSIEAYNNAARSDRAADEQAEIDVLQAYVPVDLTDEELGDIVNSVFAANGFSSMKDMGQAMKTVNAAVAGRAAGKRVSDLVKSRLA